VLLNKEADRNVTYALLNVKLALKQSMIVRITEKKEKHSGI